LLPQFGKRDHYIGNRIKTSRPRWVYNAQMTKAATPNTRAPATALACFDTAALVELRAVVSLRQVRKKHTDVAAGAAAAVGVVEAFGVPEAVAEPEAVGVTVRVIP
jgi:hypothetical protein